MAVLDLVAIAPPASDAPASAATRHRVPTGPGSPAEATGEGAFDAHLDREADRETGAMAPAPREASPAPPVEPGPDALEDEGAAELAAALADASASAPVPTAPGEAGVPGRGGTREPASGAATDSAPRDPAAEAEALARALRPTAAARTTGGAAEAVPGPAEPTAPADRGGSPALELAATRSDRTAPPPTDAPAAAQPAASAAAVRSAPVAAPAAGPASSERGGRDTTRPASAPGSLAAAPAEATPDASGRDPAAPARSHGGDPARDVAAAGRERGAREATSEPEPVRRGDGLRGAEAAPGRTPPAESSGPERAAAPTPAPVASHEPSSTATSPAPVPAGPSATAPVASPGAAAPAGAPHEVLPIHVEWLAARGGGSARIQLHPPELGGVELSVQVRGNAVHVVIRADEAAAARAALDGRELLADALAGRELRVESFEVRTGAREDAGAQGTPRDFQDSPREHAGGEGASHPHGNPGRGPTGEPGAPVAVPETPIRRIAPRGAIDVRV